MDIKKLKNYMGVPKSISGSNIHKLFNLSHDNYSKKIDEVVDLFLLFKEDINNDFNKNYLSLRRVLKRGLNFQVTNFNNELMNDLLSQYVHTEVEKNKDKILTLMNMLSIDMVVSNEYILKENFYNDLELIKSSDELLKFVEKNGEPDGIRCNAFNLILIMDEEKGLDFLKKMQQKKNIDKNLLVYDNFDDFLYNLANKDKVKVLEYVLDSLNFNIKEKPDFLLKLKKSESLKYLLDRFNIDVLNDTDLEFQKKLFSLETYKEMKNNNPEITDKNQEIEVASIEYCRLLKHENKKGCTSFLENNKVDWSIILKDKSTLDTIIHKGLWWNIPYIEKDMKNINQGVLYGYNIFNTIMLQPIHGCQKFSKLNYLIGYLPCLLKDDLIESGVSQIEPFFNNIIEKNKTNSYLDSVSLDNSKIDNKYSSLYRSVFMPNEAFRGGSVLLAYNPLLVEIINGLCNDSREVRYDWSILQKSYTEDVKKVIRVDMTNIAFLYSKMAERVNKKIDLLNLEAINNLFEDKINPNALKLINSLVYNSFFVTQTTDQDPNIEKIYKNILENSIKYKNHDLFIDVSESIEILDIKLNIPLDMLEDLYALKEDVTENNDIVIVDTFLKKHEKNLLTNQIVNSSVKSKKLKF